MRRRLGLISSFAALILVLAVPGTALGATYTYTIQKNTCTTSGGASGHGQINYQVKLTEYGWSSANKFTFTAKGQHRNVGSSRWRTEWNFGTFTYRFNNDGGNTWYSRWYKFNPGDYQWHRIKVVLKVWRGSRLLAKKTVYSRSC
jgi:hypothetical protein